MSRRSRARHRARVTAVHQPGVSGEVDHLPPPAPGRGPVDVQHVLETPIDALRVRSKDAEALIVGRAFRDCPEVLGPADPASIVVLMTANGRSCIGMLTRCQTAMPPVAN
jgi:hypothetical protein